MFKALYLSLVDKHLSVKLHKGSLEQLAYARALVVLIYIMTALFILAPVFLLTGDYQPSALENAAGILLILSLVSLLVVLKLTDAVRWVAAFLCFINYVYSAIILLIDQSSMSLQLLWMLIFPIVAFVFVSVRFGLVCAFISLVGFIFSQNYPAIIPDAYGSIDNFSYNISVILIFIVILLSVIIISSLAVIRHLGNISKEKSDRLEDSNKILQRLSYADNLTGLYNRNHFDDNFPKVWSQAVRDNAPLSLLLLDIDCFKQYNDNYGHSAGDDCLVKVSNVLHDALHRLGDGAYRWGGEEFLVVLSNADKDVASSIADRIFDALKSEAIVHEYSVASPLVTVSMGGLTLTPASREPVKDLFQRVDQELYRAKRDGRNQASFVSLDESSV